MCGIAGIYSFSPTSEAVDRAELRAIRDHMHRRGPDAAGEWYASDGRVAFGHRRLSIIDLSERGSQPMQSADGRAVVTFNGEIYNYRELRAELEKEGARFQSNSDTEVLLHLYAKHGQHMVSLLRGMFAFAIWDESRRGVFLARDPYGIKPLYYSARRGTLRFASQVRALIAGGRVSRELDPAGRVSFFLWGSVPEPFTYFKDISALGAGQTLWVDDAGVRPPNDYFSVAKTWKVAESFDGARSPEAADDEIVSALKDSVQKHLVADVPVGVFLSGGIDSGALVGMMREHHQDKLIGTTLSFDEFGGSVDDEVPLARSVAQLYGVEHHVRTVGQAEFHDDLPKILSAMDQPSIDGINTWFVSKSAAEQGLKVAVSGLGGDELFGGYSSFADVPRLVKVGHFAAAVPGVGRALRTISAPWVARTSLHPKLPGTVEYAGSYRRAYFLKRGLFMPWELRRVLPMDIIREGEQRLHDESARDRELDGFEQPFAAIAALEAEQYMRNQLLRDTDWASMAHSLEVRVPLVDSRLLERVAPLLARNRARSGKKILATAPSVPLPPEVTDRRKTGFSTPIQAWMKNAPQLSAWRSNPSLSAESCPWARRLAYALAASY